MILYYAKIIASGTKFHDFQPVMCDESTKTLTYGAEISRNLIKNAT